MTGEEWTILRMIDWVPVILKWESLFPRGRSHNSCNGFVSSKNMHTLRSWQSPLGINAGLYKKWVQTLQRLISYCCWVVWSPGSWFGLISASRKEQSGITLYPKSVMAGLRSGFPHPYAVQLFFVPQPIPKQDLCIIDYRIGYLMNLLTVWMRSTQFLLRKLPPSSIYW